MKKCVRPIFTLLLIYAVFYSAALPVSATGIYDSVQIGNEVSLSASAQESGLPFTFSPDVNVSLLWHTNRDGGYNFVPGRVEGTTINITGSFEHNNSFGKAKASVCYPSGGTYYAAIASEVSVGNSFNGSAMKEILDDDRTYYGGIKSTTSGYITSALVTIYAS